MVAQQKTAACERRRERLFRAPPGYSMYATAEDVPVPAQCRSDRLLGFVMEGPELDSLVAGDASLPSDAGFSNDKTDGLVVSSGSGTRDVHARPRAAISCIDPIYMIARLQAWSTLTHTRGRPQYPEGLKLSMLVARSLHNCTNNPALVRTGWLVAPLLAAYVAATHRDDQVAINAHRTLLWSGTLDNGFSSLGNGTNGTHDPWPEEWDRSPYEQALEQAFEHYAGTYPKLRAMLDRVLDYRPELCAKDAARAVHRFNMIMGYWNCRTAQRDRDRFSAERHAFLYSALADLSEKPLNVKLLDTGSDMLQYACHSSEVAQP